MVGGGCASAGGASSLATLGLLALLLAPLRRRRQRAVLVTALLLLAPKPSRAQTAAVDAQRFDPRGGAHDILAVPSARVPDHLAVSGGFLADYAAKPLRLVSTSAGRSVDLVEGMTSGTLTATIGLLDRSELSLALPLAISGTGQRASSVDARLSSETPAAGIGDLRVTPKVSLVSSGAAIRVALLAPVSLPTGNATYQSARTAVVAPAAALELGAPGGVRVAADLGVRLRRDQSFAGVDLGTAFVYGVAGEVPILGGRLAALGTVSGAVGSSSDRPLEVLAAVRVRGPAGLDFTVGGGPGLSHTYGTPQYRIVAGLQFSRRGPPRGAELASSSTPKAATVAPEARAAVSTPVPSASSPPKTPFVARTPASSPRAILAKGRILLQQPLQFVSGRDEVAEGSLPVLDEVAALLGAHPEIVLLRIEVHTDDDGVPAQLLASSRRRANAIRARLVRGGVAADRLDARGYGDTRPLTSNYSARDRAANRRVELVVAEGARVPATGSDRRPRREEGPGAAR
jgi:MYXO-CTERM domain-containing protein